MKRKWGWLAGLVLVVAACGGQAAGTQQHPAPTEGCTQVDKGEEIYVVAKYDCGDHFILTFNTPTARDSWIALVEEFGGVIIEKGDTWVKTKDDE